MTVDEFNVSYLLNFKRKKKDVQRMIVSYLRHIETTQPERSAELHLRVQPSQAGQRPNPAAPVAYVSPLARQGDAPSTAAKLPSPPAEKKQKLDEPKPGNPSVVSNLAGLVLPPPALSNPIPAGIPTFRNLLGQANQTALQRVANENSCWDD
jgi:hypothetical protein